MCVIECFALVNKKRHSCCSRSETKYIADEFLRPLFHQHAIEISQKLYVGSVCTLALYLPINLLFTYISNTTQHNTTQYISFIASFMFSLSNSVLLLLHWQKFLLDLPSQHFIHSFIHNFILHELFL